MKKIVGIIAALALAGFVFADAPSVSPVIADFNGDASLEWIADLDAETTGMKNTQNANFKVTFISEGTKATTGEGLWGELEIKVGKTEAESKLSDGAADVNPWLAAPSVEKAIIHFVDDDFYASMDIKGPDLGLGGGDIFVATQSKKAFPATDVALADKAGFKINFGLKDLFDANFSFADNGEKISDAKEYAFKLDGSLKAVENLLLYAGVAYSTEEEATAFAAKASYKVDLGDFYLRPSVGFTLKDEAKYLGGALMFGWADEGEGADANFAKFTSLGAEFKAIEATLTAAAEADAGYPTSGTDEEKAEFVKNYLEADFTYLIAKAVSEAVGDGTNIPNKVNNGVSVFFGSDLEDGTGIDLLVGFYDDKLLGQFVPGLALAAQFETNTEAMDDLWFFDAALKYSGTFDIWTISANFGLKTVKFGDDTNSGFLYGFGVSTDNSIIQNTKLYAEYVGETAEDLGGANLKGKVTVGAKIHF